MKYFPDKAIDHLRDALDIPDLSGTRYRFVEEIGRGGMGAVYKVEDTVLARMVALKIVGDEDSAEEAHIIAALEHPGIVPVHDAGRLPDGRAYYAMKLVEGNSLGQYRGTLTARLRLFQKICETMAFAHSRNVVHGDLKPDNIMVGAFGEALVMDWGVAAIARRGGVAGTCGYLAPEKTASVAGDIYSLGAILHDLSDEAPPALVSIAAKAMAAKPEDRYGSPLDLSDEIARYLDGQPVLAHRETLWERGARVFARHRFVILLVLAYLVMRGLLLLFMYR